jgi:hypothetical protein
MNDIQVVFNSRHGATGTNRNDLFYNFDWSKLKDTFYEVSFTCITGTGTFNGDKIAMLYVHLGNTPLVYKPIASTASTNTEFIGFLKPELVQTATPALATYLYASESSNPNFHLNGRPTQQNPRITFRDATDALYTDSAGAELPHYILTMHLTEKRINIKEQTDRYA